MARPKHKPSEFERDRRRRRDRERLAEATSAPPHSTAGGVAARAPPFHSYTLLMRSPAQYPVERSLC
jgi:hypothetical protein